MSLIPVLEVGGTHVTGAVVDPVTWTAGQLIRQHLDASGTAEQIIAGLTSVAKAVAAPADSHWGVGVPGPFDHASGIARYCIDKFTALNGLDLGAALRARIPASDITFSDDAEDFLIGEWLAGAVTGHDRVAGITLGTGVGSAFLADGQIVRSGDGVPPRGDLYRLEYQGLPIEETVSRRAIRRQYAAGLGSGAPAGPDEGLDVHEIADRARAGDHLAARVLEQAFTTLGQILGPLLARFGASVLVVGGSMAGSWDLVQPPLQAALGEVDVVPSKAGEMAPILGAAWWTTSGAAGAP